MTPIWWLRGENRLARERRAAFKGIIRGNDTGDIIGKIKKKSPGIMRRIEEKPGGWQLRVRGNRDGRGETKGLSDG